MLSMSPWRKSRVNIVACDNYTTSNNKDIRQEAIIKMCKHCNAKLFLLTFSHRKQTKRFGVCLHGNSSNYHNLPALPFHPFERTNSEKEIRWKSSVNPTVKHRNEKSPQKISLHSKCCEKQTIFNKDDKIITETFSYSVR